MATAPTYLTTTDPRVIDTITRNVAGRSRTHRAACEFAARHGAANGSHYGGSSLEFGSYSLRAIDTPTKPTDGQWKAGYRGYGWVPYKRNPLAEEMASIIFTPEPIPGLPTLMKHGNRVGSPVWFVQDEAAWAHLNYSTFEIITGTLDLETYGWEEVLGSQYHQAAEAYEAAG